jgi:hypothetical protein
MKTSVSLTILRDGASQPLSRTTHSTAAGEAKEETESEQEEDITVMDESVKKKTRLWRSEWKRS